MQISKLLGAALAGALALPLAAADPSTPTQEGPRSATGPAAVAVLGNNGLESAPNLLAPPSLPTEPVAQLRLRDGRIVWGWVAEHDPDSVVIQRLSNGGRATLPWSHLDPTQEAELKELFGYVDLTAQEITVQASRIPLRTGEEIVALITSRSDQYLEVKNAGGILQIPVLNLAGTILSEQVPAREIYTRDELYELEARRFAPELLAGGPAAAEAHFELGRYSERIFDFRRALVHYSQIADADPTFEHPDLEASLARAERRAQAQEQADMLDEIDRLRARNLYPKAVELLERFPEVYPDSPLTEDLVDLRDSVLRDRERDMIAEVERRWHHWVRRVARDKASDDNYESVLAWMEEGMAEEVTEKVAEDLQRYEVGVSVERIRELWGQRAARRNQRATYGIGTWMLGREGARAGLEEESEETAGNDPRSEERQQIEERIQRYLRNQQVASAGGREEEGADPQEFWEQWSANGRAQWMVAFYAEQSGDMLVTRATVRPCRECGGTGVYEFASMGGGGSGNNSTRLMQCNQCHGVAVIRRVSYR